MSNIQAVKKKRENVIVELDEPLAGEHELRYTLEAFGEMEEEYGTVKDAIEQTKTGKMKPVTFMLWAGLLYNYEDPKELPLRNVAKSVRIADLNYYIGKITEALAMDLPEDAVAETSPNEIGPAI